MIGQSVDISIGQVTVEATKNGGHPPEFYAERIVDKLISVSETAPPAIRLQALAYQATMRQIVLAGVRGAILSNHTTVISKLREAGMIDAASLVYELHRR